MKVFIAILVLLVAGAAGYVAWAQLRPDAQAPAWRTAEVQRGDVVSAINATGTVEPEEVVDVGAQVAGMILSFGTDTAGKPIDYGSEVDVGTVLAKIDDSLYAADAASAHAEFDNATAGVARAEADLVQLRAKLAQAAADWQRAQQLGPSDLLAQSAYDAYKAAFEVARANVTVGEAAVQQAKAGVPLAQASVQRSERNLGYCVIRSPVKGVIIDRRVNIGQTVVSSLNAPSLFLIAKDLRRVQVWAAVNEADIGSVKPGQPATFAVDAWPGRSFRGEVLKVRLNAAMTQNVVTYTVEIAADNSDGLLLPYLTANVSFLVAKATGALTVPNAALRFQPPPERVEAGGAAAPAEGRGGRRGDNADGGGGGGGGRRGALWLPAGANVRRLAVKVGLSDGVVTEVEAEGLAEGAAVVVGDDRASAAPAASPQNPFTPQMRRGR